MSIGAAYLFVYGTLRRGSNNQFARSLAEQGQFVANARLQGKLYDFGRYPGAVRSDESGQWVHGEVHSFEDSKLLLLLDEYEGPEFERAVAAAELEDRRMIDCWIYWYVGAETGRPITSGDWRVDQFRK